MNLTGQRESTTGAAAAVPLAVLPAGTFDAPRDISNLPAYLAKVEFWLIIGAEFVVDNGLLVHPGWFPFFANGAGKMKNIVSLCEHQVIRRMMK